MQARRSRWDGYALSSTAAERRAAEQFFLRLQGSTGVDGRMRSAPPNTIARISDAPVEVMDSAPTSESNEGQRAVHLPLLVAHAAPGATYDLRADNCILRWANLPPGYSGSVDVVVHFHGHDRHNAMRLQHKAASSGVDLDAPGVSRPIVGIIPHGHAFPPRVRCGESRVRCSPTTWTAECGNRVVTCRDDGFDFPALESRAGLLALIDAALRQVARECASTGLSRGRTVITGHSGGGAQLNILTHAFRGSDEVMGFQYFDATYGGEPRIGIENGWLARALQRNSSALSGLSEAEWPSYMRRFGNHLRVVFIDDTATSAGALTLRRIITQKLRELVSSDAQRAFLARYYRVQASISRNHGAIPHHVGGRLLADAGDELQGILREPRPPLPARANVEMASVALENDPPLASEPPLAAPRTAAVAAPAPAQPRAFTPQGGANTAALTQDGIDRLVRVAISGARDLQAFFARSGRLGFTAWYNAELAGKEPFMRRGHAVRMPDTAAARGRFDQFWNQIATGYGRPQITLLEFAAMMCIVLNETGGQFEGFPERCGRGRTDARGDHPGLAYAFDRIIDVKYSYNTLSSNRTAGALFDDPEFVRAHGNLPGGARLANRGSDQNGVWHGEFFPQQAFDTSEDPTRSGFLMQADFYKFRGRGVIQTTGRSSYLSVVRFIQGYQGSSALIAEFRDRFRGLSPNSAATVSTTADWDRLFDDPEILATGPALHGRQGSVDYRIMDRRADVLNHVPPPSGDTRGTSGSIYALGRRVSGRHRYGAGIYRDRVLALLNAAVALV